MFREFYEKLDALKRASERYKRHQADLFLKGEVEQGEEQWKPVAEAHFSKIYEVSNLGRVRSKDRWIWTGGHKYLRKGKVLQPCINKSNGYFYVVLSYKGVQKDFTVHSLVANAWLPRVKGLDFINHKNENKLDNRVCNLERCTPQYNVLYNGLSKRQAETRYEHGFTKRVRARDAKTGEVKHFKSLYGAAKVLKSSPRTLKKYAKLEKPIKQGFYIDLEN
ncbi:NUMOD4 domain-containing protein [Lactobacillus crispatus]|uniref:NUMOD4 domain-containing protein n=1 Tax=Lactobacillus crispatus TaxID=47770 RepID=UPI0030F52274